MTYEIILSILLSAASHYIKQVEILVQQPMIDIRLKFRCVLFVLNLTVANKSVSRKSSFRLNARRDIINVKGEQQWTKNGSLWNTRQTVTKKRPLEIDGFSEVPDAHDYPNVSYFPTNYTRSVNRDSSILNTDICNLNRDFRILNRDISIAFLEIPASLSEVSLFLRFSIEISVFEIEISLIEI